MSDKMILRIFRYIGIGLLITTVDLMFPHMSEWRKCGIELLLIIGVSMIVLSAKED